MLVGHDAENSTLSVEVGVRWTRGIDLAEAQDRLLAEHGRTANISNEKLEQWLQVVRLEAPALAVNVEHRQREGEDEEEHGRDVGEHLEEGIAGDMPS